MGTCRMVEDDDVGLAAIVDEGELDAGPRQIEGTPEMPPRLGGENSCAKGESAA